MLAGSLQLEKSNFEGDGIAPTEELQFEGVTRRKFAAIEYRFPLSRVSSQ